MSEEELNEAIEYNLEYMEAMQSEEIFGGDYTSSVELKYANKTIDRLQQENQQLKAKVDLLTGKKLAEIDKEAKQIKIKAIKQQDYKNIIDELEKWLKKEIKHYKEHFEFVCKSSSPVSIYDTKIILEKDDLIIQKIEKVLNKLQELKEKNN